MIEKGEIECFLEEINNLPMEDRRLAISSKINEVGSLIDKLDQNIALAKEEVKTKREPLQVDWWHRTRYKRNILGREIQKLQQAARIINMERTKITEEKNKDIPRLFMKLCRKRLPIELYEELLEDARKLT